MSLYILIFFERKTPFNLTQTKKRKLIKKQQKNYYTDTQTCFHLPCSDQNSVKRKFKGDFIITQILAFFKAVQKHTLLRLIGVLGLIFHYCKSICPSDKFEFFDFKVEISDSKSV